ASESNAFLDAIVESLHATIERSGRLDEDDARTAAALAGAVEDGGPFATELRQVHCVGLAGERRAIGLWEPRADFGRLGQRFGAVLERVVLAPQYVTGFSAQQAENVARALELLDRTIPAVAAGLLAHVRTLCRVATVNPNNSLRSASRTNLPGVVFLGDPVLTNPLVAAEHLLHEACHQRYREIRLFASILSEGYGEDGGTKILTPWHRPATPASLWDVDKALTAAHVYLHLAYFYGALHDAQEQPSFVPADEIRRRSFSKIERVRFLLDALHAVGRPQLGYAGNLLLDWMRDVAATFALEDQPEPRLTRLVFERYAEEDAELRAATDAFAARFSADPARLEAFAAWLEPLEPAVSERFLKCLTGGETLAAGSASGGAPEPFELLEPLSRYQHGRAARLQAMERLLTLRPAELARRTDHRLALAFAQFESANLDKFLDPAFRDRLVRERAAAPA
ncbi:MAG: hypothetical protein QOI11_308, partial [Candidatus Eremiobacteraeota bacterium]|nr:hypothetical protein [Candidatus Eremiobacteraeota bacterium]